MKTPIRAKAGNCTIILVCIPLCIVVTACNTVHPTTTAPLISAAPVEAKGEPLKKAVTPPPKTVCPIYQVLFEAEKASFAPNAKVALDVSISELKRYPKNTMMIVGHTSDDEARANPESQVALGLRRAKAAKAYLVEQGIEQSRVSTESKGSASPAVPNDSPAHQKLNRRVELNERVN